MGFFLFCCGKPLLNQRQRKLHTSGFSKLYLLTPGWPQVELRDHLSGIISTGQKAVAELHTGEPSMLPPLSLCCDLLSVPLDSPPKYRPTSRAFCFAQWSVYSPSQMQHNKSCRRYQSTNPGAHLMEPKKNVAVLLSKGCHDTQTYTLPFLLGIQPKQMWGSSQQKGWQCPVSAASKQLEPPMSLSFNCSWTIAFLWSTCITRSFLTKLCRLFKWGKEKSDVSLPQF